jgi:hypothetical protein
MMRALLLLALVGCVAPSGAEVGDAGRSDAVEAAAPEEAGIDAAPFDAAPFDAAPFDSSIACCRWFQQTWIPIAPAEGGPVYSCFASTVQSGCPLGYSTGEQ